MIRSAVENAGPDCEVFAVTILTSLTRADLAIVWGGEGLGDDLTPDVMRLALLAERAGVAGVVCSGLEAPMLRDRFGTALKLLIPGVRLPGADLGDQSRVVTPMAAAEAGASYVVLGRTVTSVADPARAMDEAVASLG